MVATPYDFQSIRISNNVQDAIARYTKDVSRDPIEGWISGGDAQSATKSLGDASQYNAEWIENASNYWGRFTKEVTIGSTLTTNTGSFRGLKAVWGSTEAPGTSPWGFAVNSQVFTFKPVYEGISNSPSAAYLSFGRSNNRWSWLLSPRVETENLHANEIFAKSVPFHPQAVPNIDFVNKMIDGSIGPLLNAVPKTFAFVGTFNVPASPGVHPNNWTQGLIPIPSKGWEWINYWTNEKGRKISYVVNVGTRSNGVGHLVSVGPANWHIALNFVQFRAANAHSGAATVLMVVLDV